MRKRARVTLKSARNLKCKINFCFSCFSVLYGKRLPVRLRQSLTLARPSGAVPQDALSSGLRVITQSSGCQFLTSIRNLEDRGLRAFVCFIPHTSNFNEAHYLAQTSSCPLLARRFDSAHLHQQKHQLRKELFVYKTFIPFLKYVLKGNPQLLPVDKIIRCMKKCSVILPRQKGAEDECQRTAANLPVPGCVREMPAHWDC